MGHVADDGERWSVVSVLCPTHRYRYCHHTDLNLRTGIPLPGTAKNKMLLSYRQCAVGGRGFIGDGRE